MGLVGSAMQRTVLGAVFAVLALVAPAGPAAANPARFDRRLARHDPRRCQNAASAWALTFSEGSGVVIDGGRHVLTIGYLILEADSVEIVLAEGRVVAATVVAYDYDTGFGLVHPLAPLGVAAIELGRSARSPT